MNSSVELFFKPGALSYGWSADFELDWNGPPAIILDMEFRHCSVWVVFKLVLRAEQMSVTIEYISFGKSSGDPEQDTAQLINAIAGARLPSPSH